MAKWLENHKGLTRALFAFCLGLLSALCLASAPKDVVIWGPSVGADSKGLEAAIRAFDAKFPQYHIKLLAMGAGGMNPQKLMTAIVGGVLPDVIDQDRFTINDWAARGAFQPLDSLIARDAKTDPETPTPDKYYPAAWHEATYEGQLYGIPTGADNRALYWNKAIFHQFAPQLRAAGLDPNRPPQMWSELLAYSKVLTIRDKSGHVIRPGFIPNFGNSWLYMYCFLNDAPLLSQDGTHCLLSSEPVRESLDFMLKAYDIVGGYNQATAISSTFGQDAADPFVTGQLPMKIDGDWTINNIVKYGPDLDYGVAPAPIPDDRCYCRGRFKNVKDRFITWIGGWSLAIPRGARNIEGGWAWIKFYLSPEGKRIEWTAQRAWERAHGKDYSPEMLASKQLTQLALADFAPREPRNRAAYLVHIGLASKALFRPSTFAAQALWDAQVRALDEAGQGSLTPQQALEQGQNRVQRELNDFLKAKSLPLVDLKIPAVVGLIGFVAGIALFGAQFFRRYSRLKRAEARWGLLFITPWVFGFFILTLGPMLASLFFSFTEWNVLTPARWVGFGNYGALFGADRELFFKSLANVLYVSGIGVPLSLFTSLSIALLLNNKARGLPAYRAFFYIPSLVPSVASAALWLWILNPDPARGLANSLWKSTIGTIFGVGAPAWFSAPEWARPSLILMGLWGAGGGIVLWLAGLNTLSPSLFEAAKIDGASSGRQFWSIMLPQLSPIIFFSTVVGFIGALQQFEQNYLVTSGTGAGPNDTLLSPAYYLFTQGFGYFKMGYASAIAWVLFLIVMAVTAIQFFVSKRWVSYEVQQ
ncbi:MAG TPA: extracellular solute-binding protein [Fimbriimonadaceae bacterium]|jgi:multiple sugar transport system permease protein